ncbi:MAG: VOC family protein [Pseudomonadota bacterium]|nr:VOC family protein [Pseudomonadota bacterium]
MLGRFLEFSLATTDIRASLDFYARLGFSPAQVGEAWPHPYAVLTDGRVCLGLHQDAAAAFALTFVRPDLLKNLRPLDARGVRFEFRRLGNDVFNEAGWLDPSGQMIRLIEARTFSPSTRLGTETSKCGYFLELALPTSDIDESRLYWEQFGFIGIDASDDPLPHVSCTSDHINLGFYDTAHLRRPTLRFEVEDMRKTVAHLADIGLPPTGEIPSPLGRSAAAVLVAPEGTRILLTSA